MKYFLALHDGIIVANRNWQLVLLQFFFAVLSFVSLFVIVVIPLAIAFVIFSIDLTQILQQRDFVGVVNIFLPVLKEYFAVVIFVGMAFLLYLASIIALWIYLLAGTLGSLARTIQSSNPFSFHNFFHEARRLFFPVFFFSNLTAFSFGILAVILGLLAESAKHVIILATDQEATLGVFIYIFFSIVLLSVGVVVVVLLLGIFLYGLAALVFGKPRALRSLKRGFEFVVSKPASLVFLGVLLLAYLLTGLVALTVTSLFVMMPAIGAVLAVPFQFLLHAAHGYAAIVILSSILLFYFKSALPPAAPLSSSGSDTSAEQAAQPAIPLSEEVKPEAQ